MIKGRCGDEKKRTDHHSTWVRLYQAAFVRIVLEVFRGTAASVTPPNCSALILLHSTGILIHSPICCTHIVSGLVPGWQDRDPETCINNGGLLDLSYNRRM